VWEGKEMIKILTSMVFSVTAMPVIGALNAETTMERLGKGTAQMVLAVAVVALAGALLQVFRLHRKDSLDARKELTSEMKRSGNDMRNQMEKSQEVISQNTAAMTMMARSNEQLREALYHLSSVIDRKLGPS
jgi:tellurite resistance protein